MDWCVHQPHPHESAHESADSTMKERKVCGGILLINTHWLDLPFFFFLRRCFSRFTVDVHRAFGVSACVYNAEPCELKWGVTDKCGHFSARGSVFRKKILNPCAVWRTDVEACAERVQVGEAASRLNAHCAGADAHEWMRTWWWKQEGKENKEAGTGPPGQTAWQPYFISGNAPCLSVCPA